MPRSARVAERRGQRRSQANPPFDPRITTLSPAGGVSINLKRGRLVTMDQTADVGWTLRFLYNPSTINLSHGLDLNLLEESARSEFDASTYNGDTQSSLEWSLLFDRTYETWDRKYRDTKVGRMGVYMDVRALYGMLGMVDQNPTKDLDLITGPMTASPVQVYFGGSKLDVLSYYGRLSSVSVQYTHWTQRMVPNRAVIGLSMQIFPKPESGFTASGPSSSSSRGGKKKSGSKGRTVPPHGAAPIER